MSKVAQGTLPLAFPSGDKLEIVQVWRFFAAAVVVVAHAYSRIVRVFPARAEETLLFAFIPTRTWGHLGVDFFFVISGFIMVWTSWDRFGVPGAQRAFWLKRIARVVPVYWFATTLAVSVLIVAPQLFSFGQRLDFRWIACSYFFIPTISPGGELFSPVLGLGWTLNFEMYFYLIFGGALVWPREHALRAIALFFAVSVGLGVVFSFRDPILIQNTSWLLMEFALGAWIGLLLRGRRRANARLVRVIFWSSTVLLLSTLIIDPVRDSTAGRHFTRFIGWGIPCAGLLYSSLLMRQTWLASPFGRGCAQLGNASYSIYLFQLFALPAVALAMRAAGVGRVLPIDIMILLLALCAILIGFASYWFLERPLSAFARKLLTSRGA